MSLIAVNTDHVARNIDSLVYIGLGIAVLVITPIQIRRKLKSSSISEAKAKKLSQVVWPLGLLLIGYGCFRIFTGG